MQLQTNIVAGWIEERAETLKTQLEIKTVIQGDFTSLPAPKDISDWANILLIKPTHNSIEKSTIDGLFRVTYYVDIYFLRVYSTDEPISASMIDATELLVKSLFFIDEDEERLPDGSPIAEGYVYRVDYDSDVQGLLRALDTDVTASKISYLLIAEQ